MTRDRSTVIFYYHGCEWDDAFPSRQHALCRELARRADVIFLTGGRASRSRWLTEEHPAAGITVLSGLVNLLTALERRHLGSLARAVGYILTRRFRDYARVVFVNAENWRRPYRFIAHDELVFDCMDPCLSGNQEVFDELEGQVLRAADLVFATADALLEHCQATNPASVLLNNACDPDDAILGAGPAPAWWPTRGPIATYLGSLDARFDFEAVAAAARANPGVSFVIAGRQLAAYAAPISSLLKLPNVILPGLVSIQVGHFIVRHADVCLIPFRQDGVSDAVNPVKLYSYALRGKPIVGTSVRELRSRPEVVESGDGPDAFAAKVTEAVGAASDDSRRRARVEFAMANTWAKRGEVAWAAIDSLTRA